MIWEDFWEAVQLSANSEVEEKNASMKFDFMMNVSKKDRSKWKDLELPFPAMEEKEAKVKAKGTENKDELMEELTSLPSELMGVVYD